MAVELSPNPEPRIPLTRQRVLRAAVGHADRGGLPSLTMRSLAAGLGVEAMSLYHHVANKDDLLDGVIEVVVGEINDAAREIDAVADGDDWKQVLRQRILAARQILLRHPWAPGVMETRTTTSPLVMRYYDDLLGLLRRGGFSNDLAHHALHVLGSRALGFTQELFEPDDDGGGDGVDAAAMLDQMADQFPNIAGMVMEVSHGDPANTLGWCDDQFEFEFALDLILEGLERRRDAAPSGRLGNRAPA
jgi:AcrR family transcriptional regulator